MLSTVQRVFEEAQGASSEEKELVWVENYLIIHENDGYKVAEMTTSGIGMD